MVVLIFILGSNLGGVGPEGVCGGGKEGVGVRSGPGAARTILLFHTISDRPSKQPRMVRTFLKVYGAGLRQALRCGGNLGRVGFDTHRFSSWDGRCPTLRATHLFPSKENREIPERDDLGPQIVPGGQEIGLGSRNLLPRRKHVPLGALSQRSG